MDILSPINHISEVGLLREAGATELYCGLMRPEILREFTNVFSLNSRHVSEANLPGFKELKELAAAARAAGMKVFVTYNAMYPEQQFGALTDEVARTLECGIDGLIVADVALMQHLRERHPETNVIVSTLGGAFNSRSCRMYGELGASRITLPRPLTVGEISAVAAACPDMEFEVFIMSERCFFPNALCNFEHATYRVRGGLLPTAAEVARRLLGHRMSAFTGTYSNRLVNRLQDRFIARNGMMCCREYDAELLDSEGRTLESGLTFRFMDVWNSFREACGLCSLYDIVGISNARSVKVVGRQSLTSKKCAEVSMIRRALDLLEEKPAREDFERAVKDIRKETYPLYCGDAYCYYNELK
ncbi:U32 family peptidase [bacterium]